MVFRQALVSMASMTTELMTSKGVKLGQQQRIIASLQSQLHAFCADMLSHMQVSSKLWHVIFYVSSCAVPLALDQMLPC